MRLGLVTFTLTSLAIAGCAVAQTPKADEDHSAHHPAGSPPAAAAPAQRAQTTPDAFDRQMKAMQDMHQRMQAAKTPAERMALMDEHMKLMQSGMTMMGQMRGMGAMAGPGAMGGPGNPGSMGMMPPQSPGAGADQGAPGMRGMAGMMGMHQHMERRMAMMEQMMQMMVDRETAMPRK